MRIALLAVPTAATLLFASLMTACVPPPAPDPPPRLTVADVLGSSAAPGFERAVDARELVFPDDHGNHPEFASEWWYFTGNLEASGGRRFGYQLTFFRTSLEPPGTAPQRESRWATEQVWMAHFAVTDVQNERLFAFDRFERGALDLAGADIDPWRVWLDDWSLEQVGDEPFPLRLRAAQGTEAGGDAGETIAIDLTVAPQKPLILQGDAGLSRKGSAPGNASYYYSFTRLTTNGSIRIGAVEQAVSGSSWLDREWGTSALESGQVGWDWFALQLSDSSELMFYQLRRADGSAASQSAGKLIAADGSTITLDRDSFSLTVEGTWDSPLDGTVYPSGWTISVPGEGIELRVDPVILDQELDLAFRYWEGAVVVRGTGADGLPLRGRGYVELAGYAEGRH